MTRMEGIRYAAEILLFSKPGSDEEKQAAMRLKYRLNCCQLNEQDGAERDSMIASLLKEFGQIIDGMETPVRHIHPYDFAELIGRLPSDGVLYQWRSAGPNEGGTEIDGVIYIQDPRVPRGPGPHSIA